jgi:hypothetical protein
MKKRCIQIRLENHTWPNLKHSFYISKLRIMMGTKGTLLSSKIKIPPRFNKISWEKY